MQLINYKFVKAETLLVCAPDGSNKEVTALVLDKEANDSYWKVVTSFSAFIEQQELTKPEDAKQWLISTEFATIEAFEEFISDTNVDVLNAQIYGIPVNWVEDERQFCVLQLADDSLVENELWK